MKKLLTTIILLTVISLSNAFAQTNCLYGWYKLDGNAADASGNNLNGSLIGTTPTTDHLGNANSALHFNGVSDQINLPSNFDFPSRTISLWFKSETFSTTYNNIYESDNPYLNYGGTIIMIENGGGQNAISFHSSGHLFIYSNSVTTNTWYHVAYVITPTYLKSYVNGILVDSTAYSGWASSNDGDNFAKIGASRNNACHFQGAIDDVRIYDCALSNEQIAQLYSGQTNCLYGWYKLDGNAADASGNNLNGSLIGTTITTDHQGNANSALHFNGVSDQINLPSNFDFPSRTISLWFKSETFATTYNNIYESDNPYLTYGGTIIMVESGGGLNAISFHSSGHLFIYSNAVTANTWYHVAYVITPAYLNSYVNGILLDSTVYSGWASSNSGDNYAKIGASRNNACHFQGVIDDVRIYNCALSSDDIDSLVFTGIHNFKNEEGSFILYPNPANDNITIETMRKAKIEISNIEGQLIKTINTTQNQTIIDISSLAPGMYFIKAKTAKGIAIKKFVKE